MTVNQTDHGRVHSLCRGGHLTPFSVRYTLLLPRWFPAHKKGWIISKKCSTDEAGAVLQDYMRRGVCLEPKETELQTASSSETFLPSGFKADEFNPPQATVSSFLNWAFLYGGSRGNNSKPGVMDFCPGFKYDVKVAKFRPELIWMKKEESWHHFYLVGSLF